MESLFWWKGRCDDERSDQRSQAPGWNPCSVGRVIATRGGVVGERNLRWNPCSVGRVITTSVRRRIGGGRSWNPCSVGRVIATARITPPSGPDLPVGILVLLEGSLRRETSIILMFGTVLESLFCWKGHCDVSIWDTEIDARLESLFCWKGHCDVQFR